MLLKHLFSLTFLFVKHFYWTFVGVTKTSSLSTTTADCDARSQRRNDREKQREEQRRKREERKKERELQKAKKIQQHDSGMIHIDVT